MVTVPWQHAAVEEAAEQGDGADLFLKAVEEAAEQGDGSNLVSVLLGNLSHLTIPTTAEDQAAWHSLSTAEGSLLLTDVRLLLCERPCTVGEKDSPKVVSQVCGQYQAL